MVIPKNTNLDDVFKPTNWEDIKYYAKNDLLVKIDFTKNLIVAIDNKKKGSRSTISLGEIIPVGNPSHELYSILRSSQDSILSTLEVKGYVGDIKLSSETEEVHPTYFKDILYLSFKLKLTELKEYLQEQLRSLSIEKVKEEKALKVGYSLRLDEIDGLILNGKYRISKPAYRSIPYRVIEYALANPNKKITKEELVIYVGFPAKRELRNVIAELGFKSILKKLFFDTKKNHFTFYNNITKGDFKKRGLSFTEVDLKLKEL